MLGDPLPHLRVRDLGNAIKNAFCTYVARCTRANELGAAFPGASTATGEGLEGREPVTTVKQPFSENRPSTVLTDGLV